MALNRGVPVAGDQVIANFDLSTRQALSKDPSATGRFAMDEVATLVQAARIGQLARQFVEAIVNNDRAMDGRMQGFGADLFNDELDAWDALKAALGRPREDFIGR